MNLRIIAALTPVRSQDTLSGETGAGALGRFRSEALTKRGERLMGVFDVMGPIMIGPSSSHTAGAARIGYLAGLIYGRPVRTVQITLFNSFAETGRGHGTDRALIGGVLGMSVDDPLLRSALDIAREKGLAFDIVLKDDPDRHPNTAVVAFFGHESPEPFTVTGVSVGGGKVRITEINGHRADYSGYHDVLMMTYRDVPGMLGFIGDTLGLRNINIAYMSLSRDANAGTAMAFMKLDAPCQAECTEALKKSPDVFDIITIRKQGDGA